MTPPRWGFKAQVKTYINICVPLNIKLHVFEHFWFTSKHTRKEFFFYLKGAVWGINDFWKFWYRHYCCCGRGKWRPFLNSGRNKNWEIFYCCILFDCNFFFIVFDCEFFLCLVLLCLELILRTSTLYFELKFSNWRISLFPFFIKTWFTSVNIYKYYLYIQLLKTLRPSKCIRLW